MVVGAYLRVRAIAMPAKRSLSPSTSSSIATAETPVPPPIYHSKSAIEDRSSTFRAAFIPLLSSQSSKPSGPTAARQLQALPDFADATHRVVAWRCRGSQKTISGVGLLDLGHDDDGETYGGKTLERLLDRERIEGAVCVARWYGGVMLGRVRFDWIQDAARDAIAVWKDKTEGAKRRKLAAEEEASQKRELEETLKERDQSIRVLRKMLTDKSGSNLTETSSLKIPIYSSLQTDVLRKLERARDSTIAVLLKKIDEAEKAPQLPKIHDAERLEAETSQP